MSAGSSVETLERTLSKYLLKFGHLDFEVLEDRQVVRYNVAGYIFDSLDEDGLNFDIPVYREILATYRELWQQLGEGVEVPTHSFVCHHNPEVNMVSVDLLTADDNYIISKIWEQKDVHIESDEEQLAEAVPQTMTLYKWRVVDRRLADLSARLATCADEEEMASIMEQMSVYNAARTKISKMSNRLI